MTVNKQQVKCSDCGYTCPVFTGWSFCGPCKTPNKPSLFHTFELVNEDNDD